MSGYPATTRFSTISMVPAMRASTLVPSVSLTPELSYACVQHTVIDTSHGAACAAILFLKRSAITFFLRDDDRGAREERDRAVGLADDAEALLA